MHGVCYISLLTGRQMVTSGRNITLINEKIIRRILSGIQIKTTYSGFKHKGMGMDIIQVPVSPGEVLDKITILEIKSERISDPGKLANVRRELALLRHTWRQSVEQDETVIRIHAQLKTINETLWEIEDDIRDKERAREFDQRFVELARSVYVTNDQRANAKKELNIYLGSEIIEEKSYQDYS